MSVASEIRAEMARRGVTGTALADEVSLKRPYLSLRLNEHADLKVGELVAIGDALGVPGWELLRRSRRPQSVTASEPSSAVVVEPEPAPAVEAHGVAAVERVGAALAGVPAEALLEHEAACDSCWSLDDAARHLSGDEDPATHRSSDEEVA
ncbi:helix-turn-helix domain-containing protein [Actinomyces succiniciruminis]|uniref:Cro/C1-type HTH domain profile n=1 Tax=Actinomyces succiniciruminis TaxID=1522002 RepID=A0A1L7RIF8_9ACTO|nr:helix-turn-helix transcriptional regulator [Actinomyces succiniciruminis]CED90589.1 Cro/C1-type HTH domain profile [Actinomyces succiniciruminis]